MKTSFRIVLTDELFLSQILVQMKEPLQEGKRCNQGRMIRFKIQKGKPPFLNCHNVVYGVKENFRPYPRINKLSVQVMKELNLLSGLKLDIIKTG
jgi:hypothetical protein